MSWGKVGGIVDFKHLQWHTHTHTLPRLSLSMGINHLFLDFVCVMPFKESLLFFSLVFSLSSVLLYVSIALFMCIDFDSMRFNESSCVKCRLQAVWSTHCDVQYMCVVVLNSFIPMIDIDCSFASSLALWRLSFAPRALARTSFARELSSWHLIRMAYFGVWFAHTNIYMNKTKKKCQPISHPMPTIQWMRWWSKTKQTDFTNENDHMGLS